MIRNYLTCVLMALLSIATAETDETIVGRHLSTSYAMDTVDHFSGSVSFTATDYQILMGPNSYFPLMRTVNLEANNNSPWLRFHVQIGTFTKSTSLLEMYSFGQQRVTDTGNMDEDDLLVFRKTEQALEISTVTLFPILMRHILNLVLIQAYPS